MMRTGTSLLVALLAGVAALCNGESEAAKKFVTCGSGVKLQHATTRYRLHSHEIAYGTGSGQQSVTGFQDGDDSNSIWVVRGYMGSDGSVVPCKRGERVKHGSHLRLQHQETGKWLHSHSHRSPLSNNYEVSAFGKADESNTNDNWVLDAQGKDFWERGSKVKFQHADTGVYLWSHNKPYPRPIQGQLEVCGVGRKAPEADWIAAEGIYFYDDEEEDGTHGEL